MTRLALDTELLSTLGALVPETKTALSPLRGDVAPSPQQLEALREAGVLAADGAFAAEWQRPVAVLASSRALARVRVRSTSAFECTVWHAPDGGAAVAVVRGPEGLVVDDPAPVDDLLAGLARLGGTAPAPSAEFATVLGGTEALVFSALLDRHRAAVMHALADGAPPPAPAPVTPAVLADAEGASELLAAAMREVWGESLEPGESAVAAALDALADLELIVGDGSGARVLAPAARELAERLLLVNHVIDLDAAREEPDGAVSWLGVTCLQAGVGDVLSIERVGDEARLEVVSPADTLGYAEILLRDPGALTREAAAPDTPEATHEPAWSATHVVPNPGLDARATPDPDAPIIARLDPGLPVTLSSTTGAWSYVVCANGWSAWVDGRMLEAMTPQPV